MVPGTLEYEVMMLEKQLDQEDLDAEIAATKMKK